MKPLTIKQAAKLAHVHPETIKRWIKSGAIPDRRVKGARKIILFSSDLNLDAKQAA